jgi:hypothetical protein
MENDISAEIIRILNLIKLIIKIFYDFLPAIEILLVDNKILLSNINNLLKEDDNINKIITTLNKNIENINNITDNKLYIYNLFEIYKFINLFNNIISIFIYYIDFDIFEDLKLNISNTLKTNLNINKNSILLEYSKFNDLYNSFNNDFIEFTLNYFEKNYKDIDMISLLENLTDLYNNSFIFINLDKDIYLNYTEIHYLLNVSDIDIITTKYKINNLLIDLYINFINKIYEKNINNEINNILNITIENNKNNLFKIYNKTNINIIKDNKIYDKIKYTNLQTFNFKPITLYNSNTLLNVEVYTIYELINKLFKIKSKKINEFINSKKLNTKLLFDELSNIIKIYSNNTKEKFSIIIIKKNGNLINYDLNNLFNTTLNINNINGINNVFLQKNIMINVIDNINSSDENINLINYNKDTTQSIILLDTIDFINYRILTNQNIIKHINSSIEKDITINDITINKTDIDNLLFNEKSYRINNLNKILQNKILQNINDNSIDDFYNSINNNFNIFDDETIYIKLSITLYNNIMIYIKKYIQKNTIKNNINSYISILLFDSNNIIDIFSQTLFDFYFSLSQKTNSTESYLTYLSNVDSIVNKFKKDIFDNYNSTIYNNSITINSENINDTISDIIKISINNIINTKTHIYDNMIEKEQLLIAFNN